MEATARQFRKRNAILACLRASREHPGAEAIYEMARKIEPDISLATVYRNLQLFRQQGLIVSVGTVGGTERFDGNVTPHTHFICTECGAVQDLEQIVLPEALMASAEGSCGGRIDACQLTFTGRCSRCR